MSENLVKLFTTQFSTNLELKLQQAGSKLRGKVREGFHVGKQASPVNQVGAIQMKAPAGRFSPLNRTDADFSRRWVFPQDGELSQMIDTFDELRTIVDPKSQYLTNASYATGRAWDDAIIAAAFGTSYTGQDAAALSAETWASLGSTVVVDDDFDGTNTGLTVAKLIEARRIFRHYHVDIESDPLTIVIGSSQEANLLNQTTVVNTDYNDRPVLVDGRLTRYVGFDIVVSERLPLSSTTRSCIAFAKSGLYLGIWKDLANDVSQRKDLSSLPWQLYTAATFGATRIEKGRVVEVQCEDPVGADITP